MTFMDKVYTLRTEVHSEGGTAHFISFTDGQGEFYDLEVSEPFFMEFRQMERKNRNLQQSDWRHREGWDLWDETLYKRAFGVPKSVEELIFDAEQRDCSIKLLPRSRKSSDGAFCSIMSMTSTTARLVRWSIVGRSQSGTRLFGPRRR